MRDKPNNSVDLDTAPLYVIDSQDVVDVRFSDETRMPLPDQSHAQELLSVSIPLENRIAHLIPYVELTAHTHTAVQIASIIGAPVSWVRRTADFIGLQSTPVLTDAAENESVTYPAFSLELLREEWEWNEAYKALDDVLSAYTIAMFLAKTKQWVRAKANELAVFPEYGLLPTGHEGFGYPKSLIPQLRHLILVVPPQGDGYTADELAEITGQRKAWIISRLSEVGIVSIVGRSPTTGREVMIFPNQSLEYIEKRAGNRKPAGDWLTKKAIEKRLGKSYLWVEARIGRFEELSEIREDDNGREAVHYPPLVLEALQAEIDQAEKFKELIADRFTVTALAKRIDKKASWIEKRLPFVELTPLVDDEGNDWAGMYFTEKDGERLLALPTDILEQERKKKSQAAMIQIVNQKLGDQAATPKLIRALRKEDASVPLPQTIEHSFGSFDIFNERRKIL